MSIKSMDLIEPTMIITVRSIEPVVSNLRRNLFNVLLFQFLVENSFISLL